MHSIEMRVLGLFLLTAIAVSPAAFAAANVSSLDPVQVEKRALQLDQQSKTTLGVSIRALNLLVEEYQRPVPDNYRKESLVQEGLWGALQDLGKNGYVKLSSVFGDPNGRDSRAEFIRIVVTDKGKAVAIALLSSSSSN